MRKFFTCLLAIVVLLVLVAGGIHLSGNTANVLMKFVKLLAPSHGFDLTHKAADPDYSDPSYWASLPDRDDPADMIPAGIGAKNIHGRAPVDVFFIHPTTYLHAEDWNSPMAPDTITKENTKWTMANQASAFNGCCNVYAPRYRQVSIFNYLFADKETGRKSLELAYKDVEAAFDYFLEHFNDNRPFILAGHSQGTHHARELLKRRISGTKHVDRLVAAYIIGGGVTEEELGAMADIHACTDETDLGCVVHWATYGEGGSQSRWGAGEGTPLCTNPLSWKLDGKRAGRSQNRGALQPSGRYNIKFWGRDRAAGTVFKPFLQPIPNHTWAQCRDGMLFVDVQVDTIFSRYSIGGGRNYHGIDYALFYMDIRENAKHRTDAFLVKDKL